MYVVSLKVFFWLLLMVLLNGCTTTTTPAVSRSSEALITGSRQHILVVANPSPSIATGRLYLCTFDSGLWQCEGAWPVVLGKAGVNKQKEGDMRSPSGAFPLGAAFGYGREKPHWLKLRYRPMHPDSICVDDPDSAYYGRIIRLSQLPEKSIPESFEWMRRDLYYHDALYRYGVNVLIVGSGQPGQGRDVGSCIFIHSWRHQNSPTAGCTALSEKSLETLLKNLEPTKNPILIQGSIAFFKGLSKHGVFSYRLPFTL